MSVEKLPEYEFEAMRGLPAALPPGETLLWQGTPSPWLLARHALRVVPIAVYFLLLALWQGAGVLASTHQWLLALRTAGVTLGLGVAALSILGIIAWASARATVYSITSGRVILRHGIALTMCLNIPLRQIEALDLRPYGDDDSGELAIVLGGGAQISYLLNWPHMRPLRYKHPQPSLRALRDVRAAARVLSQALVASGAISQAPKSVERAPATATATASASGLAGGSASAAA
jgi:hypothetical protein